jgi:hypothetical protein
MYINMNYYTSKDLDRYPILNKHFADKDFQMFNITYGGDASKCFVYFTMLKALRTMSTPIFNMQYLREANITTLPTTIDEFVSDLRAIHAASPITSRWLPELKGTSYPGDWTNSLRDERHNANSISRIRTIPNYIDTR